jgi:hypothetical protein
MNSILLMVVVLAAVAMLSAAVVVVPIQQASAQSNTFNFDTNLNFDQRQSNRCSGFAGCTNIGSDNPDSP